MTTNPGFREFTSQLIQRLISLKFLNAGWEGGKITAKNASGGTITLELGIAGGMAIVTPQLPSALLRHARRRNLNWSSANAAPLFSDIIRGSTECGKCLSFEALKDQGFLRETDLQWTVNYGEVEYVVRVWEVDIAGETPQKQYLFQQDLLWGKGNLAFLPKPGGSPIEPDLYAVPTWHDDFPNDTYSPFVSSPYSMAQFQRIRYLVFAKSIANLFVIRGFNLLISHDYHAGLAPFFAPRSPSGGDSRSFHSEILQLAIGHNLGYQGTDSFYQPNRRWANTYCSDKARWDELKQDYARLVGLDRQVLEDYFVAWSSDSYLGTPNWAQAILRLNYSTSSLAGTTVSPGYAEELHSSTREKLVARILSERGNTAGPSFEQAACRDRLRTYFADSTQQDDIFTPNRNLRDLTLYRLVGVLNGMLLDGHLLFKHTKGKLDADIASKADFDPLLSFFQRDPILAQLGSESPSQETTFQSAATSLERIKAAAKERLFEKFSQHFGGREYDKSKPILFAWGRLVNQKAFHILVEAVESTKLCDEALVIVLATAPAGDVEGMEVERRLRDLSDKKKNFVFVNAFDSAFRDTCLLAARGAILTSLFEPCGLTDIEAYWFGTPCVLHRVGGLSKGIEDGPFYSQIRDHDPASEPVAEWYEHCDNTDPASEAKQFAAACQRLLAWDDETRRNRQLKALSLTQFTYEIPANRYIDLIQFIWLNQAWRWLKDTDRPLDEIVSMAEEFIRHGARFVKGSENGCSESLAALYTEVFCPPASNIGVEHLDDDIAKDRVLKERFIRLESQSSDIRRISAS